LAASHKKNDKNFVVNPKTGRLVKINSRAYNQLLKDKILDIKTDRQKNVLYDGAHASEVLKRDLFVNTEEIPSRDG
jgi:hypothetical protein